MPRQEIHHAIVEKSYSPFARLFDPFLYILHLSREKKPYQPIKRAFKMVKSAVLGYPRIGVGRSMKKVS